jgi:hypothetical protein
MQKVYGSQIRKIIHHEIKLSLLAELDVEYIWPYIFEIWSLSHTNYC